jgi:hypothetical protein
MQLGTRPKCENEHLNGTARRGRNYLSELGDDTGGEAYWQGFNGPVSFDPYLKDLSKRQQNRCLKTLVSDDTKGLEPVRVTTSVSGISLVAASRIDIQTGHYPALPHRDRAPGTTQRLAISTSRLRAKRPNTAVRQAARCGSQSHCHSRYIRQKMHSWYPLCALRKRRMTTPSAAANKQRLVRSLQAGNDPEEWSADE